MVRLLQECNFSTPTTLPSPATPPPPLTCSDDSDSQSDFSSYVTSRVQYTTYKIIATWTERANTLVKREYESVPWYSRLTNWCLAPPL